ncbi:MAG: DUF89 family protein [Deltaproteobacteria bacterium]|nr:DUF89 family protein [Candidatus Zymogenaceae bacterium]
MKMAPACRTCILEQAVTAAKISGATDALLSRILTRSREILDTAGDGATAPEVAADIHRTIMELTGNPDPYRSRKRKSTKEALAVLPQIQEMVRKSPDPLRLSLLSAAAGNIIDFGVPSLVVSPWAILEEIDDLRFHHDDLPLLEEELRSARTILYLADNAGELVFDRLFFDYATAHLPARITLAVRGGPIINDATKKDALESKVDDHINLIDTGASVPGALLSRASDEFLEIFHESDVVISKGQGNFEVLEGVGRTLYFIFKAKCDVVSDYLKVPKGSLMLLQNRPGS